MVYVYDKYILVYGSVLLATLSLWHATESLSSSSQDRLQYSHLFLVVGVGSRHGTKETRKKANVPSFDPAADFVEGTFSARHDRRRPEEVGGAKRRIAEAQATLND